VYTGRSKSCREKEAFKSELAALRFGMVKSAKDNPDSDRPRPGHVPTGAAVSLFDQD
jgi:hypothetical protein